MENDNPFISKYDRCEVCRNWYEILSRKGVPDPEFLMVRIHMKCGHTLFRYFNPNMDGSFQIGPMM